MRFRHLHPCLVGVGVAIGILVGSHAAWAASPKEHRTYWKTRYGELVPYQDPRAKRAHVIFHRVLRAAGTRPGVEPR